MEFWRKGNYIRGISMELKQLAALLIAISALPNTTHAIETHILSNSDGREVFKVKFYQPEDGDFYPYGEDGDTQDDDSQDGPSPRSLTVLEKEKLLQAVQYWADIIQPATNGQAAVLNIGTHKIKGNAMAYSYPIDSVSSKWLYEPSVLAALQGNPDSLSHKHAGADGYFFMGEADWDTEEYVPSLLPRIGKWDTYAVALHETAHTLGISTTAHINKKTMNMDTGYLNYQIYLGQLQALDDNDEPIWAMNQYTSHLYDDNDKQAKEGQIIICNGCIYDAEDVVDGFDLRKDQGYFKGQYVSEVLQGAMPGVPVKIGVFDAPPEAGFVDDNVMSHSELKNSLMSHQRYRNYTTLMEAELALLQDLGYDIDRRNFYGYSIYGNGLSINNEHGFFKRNAAGTAYEQGQYNSSILGLGLHVYGSNNRIIQQADLLTVGAGAAGIRVDGENNILTIAPNTKIHANGLNGRGVMFAYGKNHQLIQQGEVEALGEQGIALSVDFGHNALGDAKEYRGSWIRTRVDEQGNTVNASKLLPELQGSLLKQVDISGRLAGKAAAIYISPNALVDHINVLAGASIQGDIVSEYNQKDEQNNTRTTTVHFGLDSDANGQAMSTGNKQFQFVYNGNIKGTNNLILATEGGITSLNGQQQVIALTVAQDSVLSGNGTYVLTPSQHGKFSNNGTLAPGNSIGKISIDGDFSQSPTGTLLMEVDDQGQHDVLSVTGAVNASGQLSLQPLAGWYGADWRVNSTDMLQFTHANTGQLLLNNTVFSPSLQLQAAATGAQQWQFSIKRADDAYSRYAIDNNSRNVGMALSNIASSPSAPMKKLLSTLDFSAANGADIQTALPQLSPQSYSMLLSHGLKQEQRYSEALLGTSMRSLQMSPDWDEQRIFVLPLAFDTSFNQRDNQLAYDSSGSGMLLGAETDVQDRAWNMGVHAALSKSDLDGKSFNVAGKAQSYGVGVHARYAPLENQGMWVNGLLRLSYHQDEFKRNVHFADYGTQHTGKRSGWNGVAAARGGYQFALNEHMGIGPMLMLDYAHLQRSAETENGQQDTRLQVDAVHANSLQAGLGVAANWEQTYSEHHRLQAQAALNWKHELLDGDVTQVARFEAAPTVSFASSNRIGNRNALNLQAAVKYQVNSQFELGARLSQDWYGSGGRDLAGAVSAVWHFK